MIPEPVAILSQTVPKKNRDEKKYHGSFQSSQVASRRINTASRLSESFEVNVDVVSGDGQEMASPTEVHVVEISDDFITVPKSH